MHAVVARSTFPSQNAQSTPCSDHFWKLRCRRNARRCGAKHISKSKCTKHTMFGPLFDVQMSKKCTLTNTCNYTTIHSITLLYIQLRYTTTTTPLQVHYNYSYNYTTATMTLQLRPQPQLQLQLQQQQQRQQQQQLTHSLTHSLTRSLAHSLTRSLAHSLTRSLAHSLTHPAN